MKIKGITPEQQALVDEVCSSMKVSKVVATRALKTRNGDFFVGMSAAWDTVQEDAGGMGADLIDSMGEGEQGDAIVQRAMDLRKARLATLILAMRVDIQAHTHALGGGALNEREFATAVGAIKRNYATLIAKVAKPVGAEE